MRTIPLVLTNATVMFTVALLNAGPVLHAQTAYVTVAGENNVTPIDISTDTTGPGIPVGSAPVLLAITPDGSTAYVSNEFSANVTPIDLATNIPGTPISLGVNPQGIAITPDGATAYVASTSGDTVTPIDLATNTPGTPIFVGDTPRRIVITPDGTTAYVTNTLGFGTVTPIDIASNTAGAPIVDVGNSPAGVVITPDGSTLYVALDGGDSVVSIDVATGTVGTPIPVGDRPIELAITPDGATIYVANFQSDTVTPIDIATSTAGTPIPVGDQPRGIAITPDGTTAYVANQGSDSVTPIDIATNTAGTPIFVGESPRGVTITPAPLVVTISCALNAANPPPLTIPAAGQTVFFDFDITNSSGGPYTAQFWLNTTGPVNLPEIGPITRTIGAGGIDLTLRLKMTAAAPAGTWTRICDIGDAYPTSMSTSSFSFDKSAAFAPGAVPVNSVMTEAEFRAEFERALDVALAEQTSLNEGVAPSYTLEASYPNPFNPEATFRFSVNTQQNVSADLVDVLGRVVATLFDGNVPAGEMQTVYVNGAGLPTGTYVIRMVGETFADAQRVTLLR